MNNVTDSLLIIRGRKNIVFFILYDQQFNNSNWNTKIHNHNPRTIYNNNLWSYTVCNVCMICSNFATPLCFYLFKDKNLMEWMEIKLLRCIRNIFNPSLIKLWRSKRFTSLIDVFEALSLYKLAILIFYCVSSVCSDKDCLHPIHAADLGSKSKQVNCLLAVLVPVSL